WHGNDTCWRMALDLARIVHYADRVGKMTPSLQRRHLSIIDGIVAGEGNGPLAPQAVMARSLVFSDDVATGDRAACRLMGFDPAAFPLVSQALAPHKYAVSRAFESTETVRFNGVSIDERQILPVLGRRFRPPVGWREYFEKA